jgi:hypothetical protein
MRGRIPRSFWRGTKYGHASVLLTFVIVFSIVAGLAIAMEQDYVDGGTFFENSADAGSQLPQNDHARGLVFDGPLPGGADCPGGFKLDVPGNTICTHGPDAGPPGLDVRNPPGLDDLLNPNGVIAPQAEDGHDHVHSDDSIHNHDAAGDLGGEAASASSTGGVPVCSSAVMGGAARR